MKKSFPSRVVLKVNRKVLLAMNQSDSSNLVVALLKRWMAERGYALKDRHGNACYNHWTSGRVAVAQLDYRKEMKFTAIYDKVDGNIHAINALQGMINEANTNVKGSYTPADIVKSYRKMAELIGNIEYHMEFIANPNPRFDFVPDNVEDGIGSGNGRSMAELQACYATAQRAERELTQRMEAAAVKLRKFIADLNSALGKLSTSDTTDHGFLCENGHGDSNPFFNPSYFNHHNNKIYFTAGIPRTGQSMLLLNVADRTGAICANGRHFVDLSRFASIKELAREINSLMNDTSTLTQWKEKGYIK